MKLTFFMSILIRLFFGEVLVQFLNKNDAEQKNLMLSFGKDISKASAFFKTSPQKVLENCILTEPHWGIIIPGDTL